MYIKKLARKNIFNPNSIKWVFISTKFVFVFEKISPLDMQFQPNTITNLGQNPACNQSKQVSNVSCNRMFITANLEKPFRLIFNINLTEKDFPYLVKELTLLEYRIFNINVLV